MTYYVYAHYVAGESRPFYIGKGKGNRYKDLTPRNPSWIEYVGNREVIAVILERFADETEALEREIQLIAEHGRKDLGTGYLVNRSNGGELGYVGSVIDREHVAQKTKELWQDSEYRAKLSEVHTSQEWRNRISDVVRQSWQDPVVRQSRLEAYRKRSSNPEYRKKLSESLQGHPSNVRGTRWVITDEGVGKRIPYTENLPKGWRWGKLDKRSK